jgi:hypothetical protein
MRLRTFRCVWFKFLGKIRVSSPETSSAVVNPPEKTTSEARERRERQKREREVCWKWDWTGLMPYIKALNRSGLFLVRFLFVSTFRSRSGLIQRLWGVWIIQTHVSLGLGFRLLQILFFLETFAIFNTSSLLITPLIGFKPFRNFLKNLWILLNAFVMIW